MSAIRNKDTKPEVKVRQALHARGLRYRLHRRDLPGRPDIVLPKYRVAIFVHGCFWHMHKCHYGAPEPATNAGFWAEKRKGNVQRDRKNQKALLREGWRIFVIWECQTRNPEKLEKVIAGVVSQFAPV